MVSFTVHRRTVHRLQKYKGNVFTHTTNYSYVKCIKIKAYRYC